MKNKKIVLTGDRTTGNLHLGHYFGSLKNRIDIQSDDKYKMFIILSDLQVLYDHLEDEKGSSIEKNIKEVLLDYLSVGLDPNITTFFVQSQIPEISELTLLFQFFVSVARAKRNPTIKEEMFNNGFDPNDEDDFNKINCGFLTFPISQAADILCVKGELVPVGEDQLPHIEQTREIARKFNRMFGDTFVEPEGLISKISRLKGIDGNAKMSKSLGNAIFLKDSREEVESKIKKAFSGENHSLFEYGELFGLEKNERMSEYKPLLANTINDFLDPIREKRNYFANKEDDLIDILKQGNSSTRSVAKGVLDEVKAKMKMKYKF